MDPGNLIRPGDPKQRRSSSTNDKRCNSSSVKVMQNGVGEPPGHKKLASRIVSLIHMRVILFCFDDAASNLWLQLNYLPLHLGLSALEAAHLNMILLMVKMLGVPIAGFMIDKMGSHKSALLGSICGCIGISLLMQVIVWTQEPQGSDDIVQLTEKHNICDLSMTFWLFLVLRFFHVLTSLLSYFLFDALSIVSAEHYEGPRIAWAVAASGAFSVFSNIIKYQASMSPGKLRLEIVNYNPAFHFFYALSLVILLRSVMLEHEKEPSVGNLWRHLMPLLGAFNVWIFLFSVFIMGACWGVLNFSFFDYLSDLPQGTGYLFPLTVAIRTFSSLPMVFGGEWFVRKAGADRLLLVCLAVYSIRLIGYSMIDNAWWCIPLEFLEGFSYYLMWEATVRINSRIAPARMFFTLHTLVDSFIFGAGRLFGLFSAIYLTDQYDLKATFWILGCSAFLTAMLYGTLNCYFLPPLESHEQPKRASAPGLHQDAAREEAHI